MNVLHHNWVVRPYGLSLVTQENKLTWMDVCAEVDAVARGLDGVGPGCHVSLYVLNPSKFWIDALAVWRLGGTVVPIGGKLAVGELAWIERDIRASQAIPQHPEEATGGFAGRLVGGDRGESPAVIMYTSGTSGRPKAVPLTWGNLTASALASAANLGVHKDDLWLCCLPVSHIGGLSILVRSALYGTAVELQDRFDLSAVLESVASRATLVSLVPTMLHRLIQHTDFESALRSGRLRAILLGGASANEADVRWCVERGVKVFHTYGMTETASQITTAHPGAPLGCSGLPMIGAAVSIRDEYFREVQPGEVGTIFVSGPMVMSGYLGQPEENARRFREGWFDTQDWGYVDAQAQLFVLSRRDDVIISGGENVYPAEVEAALLEHPEVSEVAVFGRFDAEWGQVVCAAVVWKSDSVDLREWLQDRLARFKHPREVYPVDELPRTASGKLMRTKVREMLTPGT